MSAVEPDLLDREVRWEGVPNARDLGGIRVGDGVVLPGRLLRSGRPDAITADGMRALRESGVRTIVDLRSDWERTPPVVDGVTIVHAPIEDLDDAGFYEWWHGEGGAPHTYSRALARWGSRVVSAIAAIADAEPGGVLVHCSAGRDRTGLVVALLLREAGAAPEAVVADYARAMHGIRDHYATVPDAPEPPASDAAFDARLAANAGALAEFLESAELEPDLREVVRRAAARLVAT